MPYSKYRDFIEKYVHLNALEWQLFKSKHKIKKYKAKETILHQGDICEELCFITNGLARAYIIDEEGKDFTWSIFFNDKNSSMINLYVTDYDSFLNQTPSTLHIEALEDCELITVPYKDVQFVYNKLKKGERFGRLMSQEAYSFIHKIAVDKRVKSTKERFEEFVEKTPFLLEKVPQYHIATYLGITPQHLSRLKKEYKTTT